MKEQENNHFKTHNVNNIKELLSKAPDLKASACFIQTMPQEGNNGFLEEQGELIRNIWLGVTHSIHNIFGFRLSWTEIIFFHTGLEIPSFQTKIVEVLKSKIDVRLKSKAIFSSLSGTIENRLNEIDRMGLQLNKMNYWKEHIYHSYWENGVEVEL